MDFNQVNFKKFLKAALKVRFQGINPSDFENFLVKLFQDNGYTINYASLSGDYGADLILKKEGITTVVLIKRYHPDQKVGVQDVNQIIGAEKYYEAGQMMIVTTSSFTAPAIELCKTASVFTWDWEILKEAIYKTYQLDDQWLFDVSTEAPTKEDEYFDFSVMEVSPDQYLEDSNTPYTKVVLELHNKSGRNVNVFLDLPILLRHDKKQFSAIEWMKNSFSSGIIYNGAEVEIACYFLETQMAEIHKEDQILIPVSVPVLSLHKTYTAPLKPEDSRCFMVTYAFDQYSTAYWEAIDFRDDFLKRYWWGRRGVLLYYRWSPGLVRIFEKMDFIKPCIRICLSGILSFIRLIRKK